jgi:hypothetical protein
MDLLRPENYEREGEMEANIQHLNSTDVARLRVYWGEDENDAGDGSRAQSNRDVLRRWARHESFWAGRNRAARRSARLAA